MQDIANVLVVALRESPVVVAQLGGEKIAYLLRVPGVEILGPFGEGCAYSCLPGVPRLGRRCRCKQGDQNRCVQHACGHTLLDQHLSPRNESLTADPAEILQTLGSNMNLYLTEYSFRSAGAHF